MLAGADPEYRLAVRVVSESAWHSLFARNMFIQPGHDLLADFAPEFSALLPGIIPKVVDIDPFHGSKSARPGPEA